MTLRKTLGGGLAVGLTLAISGCATPPAPVQPPPVVRTLPPPPPRMPAGGYVGMTIPAKQADGAYFTPNLTVTDSGAVWHLRNALNVAALGCDREGGGVVDLYNAWITTHAAAIDRYYQAHLREWQAPGWIDWQRVYDDDQTRIYNFYAQPAMRAAFCAAARVEIAQVGQVADDDLPTFARAALIRLDHPFVAFYAAFDAWRAYHQRDVPPAAPTSSVPVVMIPSLVEVPSAAFTTPGGSDTATADAKTVPVVMVPPLVEVPAAAFTAPSGGDTATTDAKIAPDPAPGDAPIQAPAPAP